MGAGQDPGLGRVSSAARERRPRRGRNETIRHRHEGQIQGGRFGTDPPGHHDFLRLLPLRHRARRHRHRPRRQAREGVRRRAQLLARVTRARVPHGRRGAQESGEVQAPRDRHHAHKQLLDRLRESSGGGVRDRLAHTGIDAYRHPARGRHAEGPHHQLPLLQHQRGQGGGHDRAGAGRLEEGCRGHPPSSANDVVGRSSPRATQRPVRGEAEVWRGRRPKGGGGRPAGTGRARAEGVEGTRGERGGPDA
mmetsp:Transcript_50502/g.107578  ORF Transcript_50502/g.107578 Transcript_50502/m.107578 type:complete len:250 (-) Transcript_50502:1138-1887(-)